LASSTKELLYIYFTAARNNVAAYPLKTILQGIPKRSFEKINNKLEINLS